MVWFSVRYFQSVLWNWQSYTNSLTRPCEYQCTSGAHRKSHNISFLTLCWSSDKQYCTKCSADSAQTNFSKRAPFGSIGSLHFLFLWLDQSRFRTRARSCYVLAEVKLSRTTRFFVAATAKIHNSQYRQLSNDCLTFSGEKRTSWTGFCCRS